MAPPQAYAPGEEAIAIALRPLEYGEACQVGIGGDTGAGKTTIAVRFVDEWLKRSPGLVVVVDDKDPSRSPYKGQMRRDLAHLRAEPLDPRGPRVLILRGDVLRGQLADREAAAGYCRDCAVRGLPVLFVNDEAFPKSVAKNRQWRKGVEMLPLGFTHGRKMGAGWSNLWGAQRAIDAPAEPFDESHCLLQFKTVGDPIRLLREKDYLRGERRLPEIIAGLHAQGAPPELRGDFVLLQRGEDNDGRVYRLEKPAR